MHWIISHHILQSGACQCGVAMTTSSVPPPPPIYTHTPPLPPSFSTFSSHHHSSSSLATNRTEKNKAWEKKHFVGWNKNGGMMEERKGKEMLCSWLEQQLVFSLIVLQFGCFGGCREFFLSVRGWLCVCVCVPSAIIVPSMSSMIGSLQYSVEGNTVTLSSVIINVRLSSEPYKCSSLCTWSDPENLPSAPPDQQHLQHHKMCRKMDIYPCRKPNCICSKLEHS